MAKLEAETPSRAAMACSMSAPLRQGLRCLRLCRSQLRLRLGHIQPGRNPRIMTLGRERERARIRLHGVIEQGAGAIEAAQLDIVIRQLRRER